nr:TonB-dependent receptor [Kiritimatiellia bacterium]
MTRLHTQLLVFFVLFDSLSRAQVPEKVDPGENDSITASEEADAVVITSGGSKGPINVLDSLNVTSTRLPVSGVDSSQALTIVSSSELREKAPRTPAEALRNKPGIWVQRTGHLGGAPIIRGFMGNQVLYLFDGFRQNTAGLFAGPNSNLQNIDVLDVDRIEVVRGPGSVLYGSDAIGGIVNVITVEEPVFSNTPMFGGRSYLRYATADEEKSARQEFFISSPTLFVSGGLSARNIEHVRTGNGENADPSDSRERAGDFQVDYMPTPDHRFQFSSQVFNRPTGSRFDTPGRTQQNDRQLHSLRYVGENVAWADRLEASTYYHLQKNVTDDPHWDSKSESSTYGGGIQATRFLEGGHRLAYGAHVHMDTVEGSDPQSGTEDPSVDWYNPAVFVLTDWRLTNRLRLDVGVRVDYIRLEST